MTDIAQLRILLGLDPAGVRGGAGQVRSELRGVQQAARDTNTSLSQIGKGLAAGFGLGAGIAFNLASRGAREFTDAIGDSIRASIEEEAGINRLNASLAANVTAWDGNTKVIEQAVKANERFGFSDREVRDSLAILAAATHDTAEALELIAVAEDLARFKGISLAEASRALVTIEAGRFRGLAQLGIVLKEGATRTEALAAVQKVAGGQAEAFGRTTAGAMAEASVAVQNLQEDIGGKLSPAVAELARGLTTLLAPQRETNDNWTLLGRAIEAITNPGSLPKMLSEIEGVALAEYGAQFRTLSWAQSMADAELAADAVTTATTEQTRAALALTVATGTAADATTEQKKAAQDAMAAFKALSTVFDGYNVIVPEAAAHTVGWSGDLDTAALAAIGLKAAADDLGAALDDIPTDIDVNINISTNFSTNTATDIHGKLIDPGLTNTAGNLFATGNTLADERDAAARAARDKADDEAARERQRVIDEARRKGEQQAADESRKHAREMQDALTGAYDKVRDAATRYFDDLHDANQRAIDDTHDRANAELDAQKSANLAPVNEAEAAFRAIKEQRALAQLQADLANADNVEDRLRATQALSDFMFQAQIDQMRANADTANAALDIEKAKNDLIAAEATERERKRHDDQVRAFNDDMKILRSHLDDVTKEYGKAFGEIAALAKKYGVSSLVGVHPVVTTPEATSGGRAAVTGASGPTGFVGRSLDAMSQVAPIAVVVHNHFYVDGAEVATSVDRHQSRRQYAATSGGIAG